MKRARGEASGPSIGRDAIEAAAATLREGAPLFTARHLVFAVKRQNPNVPEAAIEAAVRSAAKKLSGIVAAPKERKNGGRDESPFPSVILLVDHADVAEALTAAVRALDLPALAGAAIVSIEGTPAALVARIARGFRAGARAPVLFLHDAETVVYPFAIEPLATLVQHHDDATSGPVTYRDLGVPPLGTSARRFADATLPADEPIFALEAVPPATLARYCARVVASLLDEAPAAEPREPRASEPRAPAP